jgi:predicted nucleic acid-binding protein
MVVDASVVIKWHVPENHSEAAQRLLTRDWITLHVPDLSSPELGNILWKKVRRGELSEDQAREIARLLAVAPLVVHRSVDLLEAALEIALGTGRTVYDSMYIALAVHLDCPLVTADEKLVNALHGSFLQTHIAWVEDVLPNPPGVN